MPNYWGDYKNFAFYIFANNLFVFQFFLFLLKFPLIVSSGMYVLISLKLFFYRNKTLLLSNIVSCSVQRRLSFSSSC